MATMGTRKSFSRSFIEKSRSVIEAKRWRVPQVELLKRGQVCSLIVSRKFKSRKANGSEACRGHTQAGRGFEINRFLNLKFYLDHSMGLRRSIIFQHYFDHNNLTLRVPAIKTSFEFQNPNRNHFRIHTLQFDLGCTKDEIKEDNCRVGMKRLTFVVGQWC